MPSITVPTGSWRSSGISSRPSSLLRRLRAEAQRPRAHRRGVQPLLAPGLAWIDIVGTICFLAPMACAVLYLSWPILLIPTGRTNIPPTPAAFDRGRCGRWCRRALLLILQGVLIADQALRLPAGPDRRPNAKDEGPSAEEELAKAIKQQRGETSKWNSLLPHGAPDVRGAGRSCFSAIRVAFALAANGVVFGLIGIELGLLTPALFQACRTASSGDVPMTPCWRSLSSPSWA